MLYNVPLDINLDFESSYLSRGLSFFQTGYSVVAACVVAIRWKPKSGNDGSTRGTSARLEGTCCLLIIALCGFGAGVCYRYNGSFIIVLLAGFIAIFALSALYWRQVSAFQYIAMSVLHIKFFAILR